MPIDVSATQAAITRLASNANDTLFKIMERVAEDLRNQARKNAPAGQEGNSTNPSGDLKRGMTIEGPFGSGSHYTARVGPIVKSVKPGINGRVLNYARQRELGGVITSPAGGMMYFKIHGVKIARESVFQSSAAPGSHYLLRARISQGPEIKLIIDEELTLLVKSK